MTVSPDDSAAPFLNDEYFMRAALRLAETAAANDEVPIGAVAVKDGVIIARGWNQVETLKDATAHAELLAMTAAASAVGDWRLDGVTVYVTKEPCAMCAGAIANARIKKVYFGAYEKKGGGAVSKFNILSESGLNHVTDCEGGVLEEQCSSLLKEFFRSRRNGCPKNLDNLQ